MLQQDKIIQCSDCGTDFTFSAAEQEYYKSRGFTNEPKRCKSCRDVKKTERYGNSPRREMFKVTCAQCGNDAEVPFKPSNDRPVYCSDCFSSNRDRR